jgi:hypothetical protein
MAYTRHKMTLETIDKKLAEKENLHIVEDPVLTKNYFEPEPVEGYGPYFCPSCKKMSLRMVFEGYWD